MVIFNSQTVSRIEGAANALMNRLLDCKYSTAVTLANRAYNNYLGSNCCMAVSAAREAKEN